MDATQYGYSLFELAAFTRTGGGDTTPPGPPGTPVLVSSTPNSATIRWTAATDDVGVVGYDVYHDGQPCAQTDAGTLTGTCNNLNPKTNYGFYVKRAGRGRERVTAQPDAADHHAGHE